MKEQKVKVKALKPLFYAERHEGFVPVFHRFGNHVSPREVYVYAKEQGAREGVLGMETFLQVTASVNATGTVLFVRQTDLCEFQH